MRISTRVAALLTVAAALPLAAKPDPAAEALAARHVRAHVTFLADDLLEGRAAGTRGYDLAARYVAAEFQALGLLPAGDNGTYFQTVKLLESSRDFSAGKLVLQPAAAGAEPVVCTALNDFLASPAAGTESAEITAPAVFVGYGVHAPKQKYSDLEGADLKGKIAVVLSGAPTSLPVTERAHFSNATTKAAELARRGAVGIVTVNPPAEDLRRPWPATLIAARFPAASLVGPDGQLVDVVAAIRATALLSPAGAAKLFAHSPKPFAAVVAAADQSKPQHFDLGVVLTIAGRAATKPFTSANVLAVLPGTDPALARDPIVVTSHLDHLGIGTPVKGDAIYNGAIDNAIGVGALLAAARHMVENKIVGRRPVVFAAVTAEEKGLLGARHLSRHPPAGSRWAANLNVDAGPFFAPLRAAIGMGREHTTLGALFEAAAARLGWAVRPDPKPEERRFVRSDQYSFVREGIPALRVVAAPESTDPKIDLMEIDRVYWKDRYHKPDDDLAHPIDFPSGGAFAILLAEVVRATADAVVPPAYLPGDFFGETFGRR